MTELNTSSRVKATTWGILLISITLTAAGQLFMKASTQHLTSWTQLLDQLLHWQLAPAEQSMLIWFSLGIGSYFTSMVLWVHVLSFLKLSRIYPLLSLAYILVYIGAVSWSEIDETTSAEKNIGVLIILIGVILVSLPSNKRSSKI